MDYQTFLMELNKVGYGVASFNTYHLEGRYNFYLMVAKKGNKGIFNKLEGEVRYLNLFLDEFLEIIKKDSVLKIITL